MVDTPIFRENLLKIEIGEVFGSLGVIFEEKLAFKNCEISWW